MQKILIYPNENLRKKSSIVTNVNEATISNMIDQMVRHGGVGIAAPQLGIHERIIVIKNVFTKEIFACVNPEISYFSETKNIFAEGCLSLPGKKVNVERSKKIVLEYETISGDKKIIEMIDLMAAIAQHEIDHLDGKLIIDYQTKR